MPNNKPNIKPSHPKPPHPFPPGEVVEPAWILKAGAAVLGVALLCSLTLIIVVFSKTQWQFVLQPSREVATTPASLHLAFEPVRFGVDPTGQPQLDGWWIPADSPTAPTVLMLHSGDGSISSALPQAKLLHDDSLNVLLFDYRGYGHSTGQHPTLALMQRDAATALNYLVDTRHISATNIVVYGNGAGASLATSLCAEHNVLPALILDAPDGDFLDRVRHDNRAKLVPVQMLFTQNFPLEDPLSKLATPKLVLSYDDHRTPFDPQHVANPKMTVELPSIKDVAAIQQTIHRFLDTYISIQH